MTIYYKINGTYVSWQEAYNSGYTQEPSNSISYKSAASATWGDSAGTGMLLGDTTDPIAALFFLEGESGWHSMNEMVSTYSVYPSTAEDVVMHNTNTGNNSAGVKIESNGDYYYLISGDLSHGWIVEGDLDDFGWEEKVAPSLPTVDTSNSNWLTTSTGRNVTINAGSVIDAYDWTSESGYFRPVYDTSKAYAIRSWYDETPTLVGKCGLSIINQNNYICIQNQLITSTNFAQGYYATCSSNQADLVTVLNSSDEAYNAFKYTVDGVDYYYVLDGVQNDWTDDLNSIGYFIPVIGYFKTTGASATTNESVSYRYWYPLYKADSASGSVKYLTGDSTKTYLPIAAVKANGTTIDVTSGYMQVVLYSSTSDVIQFKPATSIEAHHLLFKETA